MGTFAFRGASGGVGLGPVRATFTLAFLGFAPGLAVMGILRPDDLVLEISLALAVRLSLDTVLATGMTLFNGWHPATASWSWRPSRLPARWSRSIRSGS